MQQQEYQEDLTGSAIGTAFEIFKEEIVKSNPGIKHFEKDIHRKAAAAWSLLTFDEKEEYRKRAEENKESFHKQLSDGPFSSKFIQPKKKEDVRKPRKYHSPYSYFMQEMRPKFQKQYPELN